MANVFTKKSSFSLLKSNPKLTGNVKLVIDSKENIYIETIDGSIELSRNKFKGKKLDVNNSWANDVYDLFDGGNIPKSLFYALKDNENFFAIKNDFSKQYYNNYQQGAYPKISKFYDEQLSYFVPTWFEPNNIPEHFAIFKVPEPVSVNTKDMVDSFDASLEKQIYDTNYFDVPSGATDSNYFFETILKDAKLHKVYNLDEDSIVGKYLRNHLLDNNFPESSLTINWNISEPSTVNGISLSKSGFTKESFNIFDEAYPIDRTITEFDSYVTKSFEERGVIHPNIINLEFLFDDEEDDDYTINRYFGVFFSKEDISEFRLDPIAFYKKKYDNLPQNQDILSTSTIDIENDDNIVLENEDGVKLFTDYMGNYELLSSDVKGSNFIPYVYSTDNIFFDVNNNIDWGSNEIILKDTAVNANEFKGFQTDSSGIIKAAITNEEGRSYFDFTMDSSVASLQLRIRNVNEYSSEKDLNTYFIGDTGMAQGDFDANKFSLAGTPEQILITLSECINSWAERDEDFNVYSIAKENKLIVFTRGTNAYWNNYDFLIYSDDKFFKNNVVVNFGEEPLQTLTQFNNNRPPLEPFLDYNAIVAGATSMYNDPDASILESTFKGGNYSPKNRVRVESSNLEYFQLDEFLKTREWYTPIVSICSYLDEPIYQNGRIVDFDNYNDYLSINCDEEIFVSSGAFIEIYEIASNKVGLMSMYPIKQFDTDQFRSTYGIDGDGYIDVIEQLFKTNAGTTASDTYRNITEFQESGFKRLAGKLDETLGDIPYIENEYDRLSENEIAELSIKGRIIPYMNKWVYDDDGTDVRDNFYRMGTNSAFSYDNFSPSTKNRIPDPKFFTHEWYYLGEYPPYLNVDDRVDTFSYFQEEINLGATGIPSLSEDYFVDYFTQYKCSEGSDTRLFPKRFKYSSVSGGDSTSFGETFFRGAKIKVKRRTENVTPLNFNIGDIPSYPSDEFNGYKFSAVLKNDPENAIKFNVIENKKYKTITFVVQSDIYSEYSTNMGGTAFLDRTNLYTLEHKYGSGTFPTYADVNLSGAISPFVYNSDGVIVSNYVMSTNGEYIISGNLNADTNSVPTFNSQINTTEDGKYNDVIIDISGTQSLKISEIFSVTNNIIKANKFEYLLGGLPTPLPAPPPSSPILYNPYFPVPEICLDKTPVYQSGGYRYYNGILESISFASIFDKVNNGSPDISYTTINEDGTVEDNTFLLEFDEPTLNGKADYIKSEQLIFSGLKNNDFKPIGSKLTGLDNTYITPIYRYNGRYNPKVSDSIYYKDLDAIEGTVFTSEIREQLSLKNVQFFSTYPGFALFKQLYINKVNEQNPLSVLELSSNSALNPEYWRISEISLDKRDMYIFRSNWDLDFYRRYKSKNSYQSLPGYVDSKEITSMLASTIMNIPDEIKLEKYTDGIDVIINRNDNTSVQGTINNTTKMVEIIGPGIEYLFDTYVNDKFNYQKLDTFDDDIDRYIQENIFPRYIASEIICYIKYSNKNSNVNIIESNMTEQDLIIDGFIPLDNIKFVKTVGSEFDYNFIYNKPSDKGVTLAFITKIIVQ